MKGATGVYRPRGSALFAMAPTVAAVDAKSLALPARFLPAPSWVAALAARLRNTSLAYDLAEDIGTPRWWRGLATLFALTLGAWLLLPGSGASRATMPMTLDSRAETVFREAALRPLAAGVTPQRLVTAGKFSIPLASVPERPRIDLVATLGSQDSLPRLLQRVGLAPDDAAHATALVANAVPLDRIAPGTHVTITLGPRASAGLPRPLESLSLRARFDLDLSVQRHAGGLGLSQHPLAVDSTPLRVRGTVGSSLYRSARAAGAPPSAIQDYLHALDEHFALDGIAPNDQFDFVLSYRRSAGGEAEPGDLLYAGLERDGKARTQLVRFGKDGPFVDMLADFATSSPPQSDAVALGAPVAGYVTSGFGLRRHPILGYVRMHAGIDFAAGYGSPIHAVSDGQVSYAGWHGGHGNYVRLEHGGGLATGYGHMSRIAVSPGMRIARGQVIGYVGSTGLSTGPHLHYELLRDGHPVNPGTARFMMRSPQVQSASLSAEYAAVRKRLAQLLAIEPGAALAPISGGRRLGATR